MRTGEQGASDHDGRGASSSAGAPWRAGEQMLRHGVPPLSLGSVRVIYL